MFCPYVVVNRRPWRTGYIAVDTVWIVVSPSAVPRFAGAIILHHLLTLARNFVFFMTFFLLPFFLSSMKLLALRHLGPIPFSHTHTHTLHSRKPPQLDAVSSLSPPLSPTCMNHHVHKVVHWSIHWFIIWSVRPCNRISTYLSHLKPP